MHSLMQCMCHAHLPDITPGNAHGINPTLPATGVALASMGDLGVAATARLISKKSRWLVCVYALTVLARSVSSLAFSQHDRTPSLTCACFAAWHLTRSHGGCWAMPTSWRLALHVRAVLTPTGGCDVQLSRRSGGSGHAVCSSLSSQARAAGFSGQSHDDPTPPYRRLRTWGAPQHVRDGKKHGIVFAAVCFDAFSLSLLARVLGRLLPTLFYWGPAAGCGSAGPASGHDGDGTALPPRRGTPTCGGATGNFRCMRGISLPSAFC